jgi:hypothetical protein
MTTQRRQDFAGRARIPHSRSQLGRDGPESVEEVSRFLGHSSLAVTTRTCAARKGRKTGTRTKVAEASGRMDRMTGSPHAQFAVRNAA